MNTDEQGELRTDLTCRFGVAEPAGQETETAALSPVSLVEQVLAIGRDCAAHLPDEVRLIDHADLLYDERGLPK